MTKQLYSFLVGLIGTFIVLAVGWGASIALQPTAKTPPSPPKVELAEKPEPEPVETTVVAVKEKPAPVQEWAKPVETADDDILLGPELLKVTTFKEGYKPSDRDYNWLWNNEFERKTYGTCSSNSEGLKLVCYEKNNRADWIPELFYKRISLVKDKKYRIEVEMRSENKKSLYVKPMIGATVLHEKKLQLEKDWKTYRIPFTANATDDHARLHFVHLEPGGVYEIRRVSVREVLPESSSGKNSPSVITNDKEWLDKFLADHPGLTKADVAPDWVWRNGRITHFTCQKKGITGALDLSPLTELQTADLGGNEITSLNVSQNTKLKTLWCYTNKLTTLDVSKNTELELLSCNHNQLKTLDISKNTKLKTLSCQSNRLTELNLTGTPFSSFRSVSRTDQPGGWYTYNFGQDKNMHIDKSVKLLSTDSTTLADTPLGPEMLKVTTFKDGYKPLLKWKHEGKNFDWCWEANYDGKSHGSLSNTSEGLKVVCQSIPPKADWIPQLGYMPIPLVKGKKYSIEMELRSETTNKATMRVDTFNPKWHGFGNKRWPLEKDWKTYQFQFVADETCDKAVLSLHNFEVGGVYEIRRVSLREVLPEASTQQSETSTIPDDRSWLAKLLLTANPGLTESVATWENGRIVKLDVTEKGLTGTLDVSPLTELRELHGNKNRFTALDLSKNTKLKRLFFDGNQLAVLDVSQNVELNEIGCAGNQLTALDVSQNTKLHSLWCQGNRLTTLVVPKNLMGLECSRNKLTALDLSKNTNLEWLSCYGNQLTTLDVSKNGKLKNFGCQDCGLKELNVEGCKKLEFLYCERNQLTKLDVSGCTVLDRFNCHDNRLTTLDLTGTPYADLTSFIRTSHGNRYTYKDKEKDRPVMMVDQNVTLLPTQTEKK